MNEYEKLLRAQEQRYRDLQHFVLSQRFDANETLFLERELNQLRAKVWEVQYPALKARTFLPKATDIASSAETYTYKVYQVVGSVGHQGYKSTDHPRIDAVAKSVTGKVRPITGFYGWDINELREAARNNIQLSDVKGKAARDFVERGIDECLAFGSIADQAGNTPDLGCSGLVNNTDVEGAGNANVLAGDHWLDATPIDPALLLADLNKLASKAGQVTKETFESDTVLLGKANFDKASQTPFSELEGTSILATFQKNNPQIKQVSPWHLLDSVAAAQGGEAKPRSIAYKKDSMVLEAIIPQEFEMLPPEARNYELLIHVHARCGGVKIYFPQAVTFMDHATS